MFGISSQPSQSTNPDWAACNRTELYQWARRAGFPVLPSMSKKELIALLEDRVDWPSTPHSFDGLRIGLMSYILSYWSVLKGSIQCPAKSGDPKACFGCLDQQIISCVNTNAAHEKQIRLRVVQPEVRKKPKMEGLEAKVMDVPISSIPDSIEELIATPDYKLRAFANRLEMLKNEEMRAVIRAAAASTEGKKRMCSAVLLCKKAWMRCNGNGYNIMLLKKDALDILTGKRQLNEVSEVDMPPPEVQAVPTPVHADIPPARESVRPPPTPVYETQQAVQAQVLPPAPPPPRESVRPAPTPVYNPPSNEQPPEWAKDLMNKMIDIENRLSSLEDGVEVHGTAATVNRGFEKVVLSRLNDIFVASILKNTELQALIAKEQGVPGAILDEKLHKFVNLFERALEPVDVAHSIYKEGKGQEMSATGGAKRGRKKQ